MLLNRLDAVPCLWHLLSLSFLLVFQVMLSIFTFPRILQLSKFVFSTTFQVAENRTTLQFLSSLIKFLSCSATFTFSPKGKPSVPAFYFLIILQHCVSFCPTSFAIATSSGPPDPTSITSRHDPLPPFSSARLSLFVCFFGLVTSKPTQACTCTRLKPSSFFSRHPRRQSLPTRSAPLHSHCGLFLRLCRYIGRLYLHHDEVLHYVLFLTASNRHLLCNTSSSATSIVVPCLLLSSLVQHFFLDHVASICLTETVSTALRKIAPL